MLKINQKKLLKNKNLGAVVLFLSIICLGWSKSSSDTIEQRAIDYFINNLDDIVLNECVGDIKQIQFGGVRHKSAKKGKIVISYYINKGLKVDGCEEFNVNPNKELIKFPSKYKIVEGNLNSEVVQNSIYMDVSPKIDVCDQQIVRIYCRVCSSFTIVLLLSFDQNGEIVFSNVMRGIA